jgi:hypothetical protein
MLSDIDCAHNQITILPLLNDFLLDINLENNPIYDVLYHGPFTKIREIKRNVSKLVSFYHLYYHLKFKEKFRHWLYEKVRLPKIQEKYSPEKVWEILKDIDDEDELERAIDQM